MQKENKLHHWYQRMLKALAVPELTIPLAGVTLYKTSRSLKEAVKSWEPAEETITSCQAVRHAYLGDPVLLTQRSIGCIAAAISLGLVDQNSPHPLPGSRVYTDLMDAQNENGPPAPRDFTNGSVYACRDARRPEFCIFGADESGRFKDQATARRAIAGMAAIQPACMAAVLFYGPGYWADAPRPDVIVLDLRPVELTRLIQGYAYVTGERVRADMGPLRAVSADLIARPYLSGEINISPYCLGARLLARFPGDRLGMGLPFEKFKVMVAGIEASASGYPFRSYPQAVL